MLRKLPKRDDAIRLTQQQQQQQLSKLIIIIGDDFCLFPHFQYCGWMNRDQRYQITMNRCLFQLVKCAMGARDGNRGTSLSVSWAFSWVLAAWWSINSSAERGARSYLLLCLLYCNLEPPAVCWEEEEEAHTRRKSLESFSLQESCNHSRCNDTSASACYWISFYSYCCYHQLLLMDGRWFRSRRISNRWWVRECAKNLNKDSSTWVIHILSYWIAANIEMLINWITFSNIRRWIRTISSGRCLLAAGCTGSQVR